MHTVYSIIYYNIIKKKQVYSSSSLYTEENWNTTYPMYQHNIIPECILFQIQSRTPSVFLLKILSLESCVNGNKECYLSVNYPCILSKRHR